MKNTFLYIIYLLVLSTCSAIGQVHHETPYQELMNDKVNDSKTAVTYFVKSEKTRTLKFLNLKTNKELSFENIFSPTILNDKLFITYNYKTKKLLVLDIPSMKLDTITKVDDYKWIDNLNTLVYYEKDSKQLNIWNAFKDKKTTFSNTLFYDFNKAENTIVIRDSNQNIVIYNVADGRKNNFKTDEIGITNPVKRVLWNILDTEPLFLSHDKTKFYIHIANTNNSKGIFSADLMDNQKNTVVDTLFSKVRVLKNDVVVVPVYPLTDSQKKQGPEIWLGKTVGLTPMIENKLAAKPQLALADLKNGKWTNLAENDKLLYFGVSGDGTKVFAYEVKDDNSKYIPDIELYVYSDDFTQRKFVDRVSGYREMLFNTADFPYLFYLKGNDWNLWNYQTNELRKFTEDSKGEFYKENEEFHFKQYDVVLQRMATLNNRYISFYDLNDLLIYDTHKKTYKKLTNGKQESKIYRFTASSFLMDNKPWAYDAERSLKSNASLILQWNTEDYRQEGLSLLTNGFKVKPLVNDKAHYSQIYASKQAVTYLKEKANQPPVLYLYDLKTGKEKMIKQLHNPDTVGENLKTEYISWLNTDGNKQNAIIRYPANYDPSKKYPAVFYIYEDKGKEQHFYQSPFKNSEIGFNPRTYTDNGYFVVEPDIWYRYESPGASALTSVLNAVSKVSEHCAIDLENLGLTGHSFGGYETNYIATQTDVFKTAVSGAGISDIISWYLSISSALQRPEMWRFSQQSLRMKKRLFDIKEKYVANSPVLQSENCTTPLLLWSGKNDNIVDPRQSVAMFLALQDQNKPVNLLLYPNEDHALFRKENKIDLEIKVKQWFDYYLNKGSEPLWIKEGLQ